MINLATYSPPKTEQIDVGQVMLTNQYLRAEIKRLKDELQQSKATVYQQQKTIANQVKTINDLNKKVIKTLEKDKVVLNRDKVTFIQAFGMKCTEKSILGHLRTFLGDEPTWNNLNADNLQRFGVWLRESASTKRGTLLNDSTACTYITQLRQVIKYGCSDSNDTANALKTSRPAKKKKVWLRGADLRKLVGYVPNNETERNVRRVFLICAITGCRVSDAHTLVRENIDGNTFRYTPIKTKIKECFVQLSDEARELLYDLLGEEIVEIKSSDNKVLKDIFRNIGLTRRMEIGTPNRPEIVELCDAVTFHTARHSFATNKFRYSAWTEREIADALGHTSFNQTWENYIVDRSSISDEEKRVNFDSVFC